MKCGSCGFTAPFPRVANDRLCRSCGGPLKFESDDFLLHGANNLVKTVRPGQVEMARLIEKLAEEKAHGIIEGPVGIGKSFAYMVPAILSGKRIVISTAKKQLQHQIARKDAPHLATHLERPDLQAALLKGKSNYACRLKAFDIPDPDARNQFVSWLDDAEFGDITEYEGRRPKWWYDVTAEDCVGARCKFAKKCGYWRSKQQAKVASVIIANHHVVAFDLRFGPFKLLPEYDVLVIDEAHQAPAAMRGAFAQTVSPFGAQKILKAIDKVGMNTGHEKRLDEVWKEMFEGIRNLDGEVPADPFGASGEEAILILETINKTATAEMKEAGGTPYDDEGEDDDAGESSGSSADWETLAKYEMLKKVIGRNLDALRTAQKPDENTVVYITTQGEKKFKTVNVAPITVGPMVGPKLAKIPTVIVTSATISVNGNFDDIKRQLGMDYERQQGPAPTGPVNMAQAAATIEPAKRVETMVLESPFDYRRQALLYTPKHLPLPVSGGSNGFVDPKREQYLNALTTEIARLLRASDGNAFILFSATSDLNEVHKRLQEEELNDVALIPQGDDAEATFKEFMATPRSAILGLKSFWEGVDVVGDKLRLVVITKLPFPQVNDPVIQARARLATKQAIERGISEKDAIGVVFRTIQIPHMITDLRQGVGRLIRSTTDKGVCAILDSRIWTGSSKRAPSQTQVKYDGYGATTVNAIGFSQKTSDFMAARRFLEFIQGAAMQRAA